MASGSVTIKICRCCLENQAESVGLFTTLDEFQNKICDLLLECGGIPVSEEDCFPKYICAVCLWDLCTAVRFKMRCLKSQEVLQKEQFVVEELQQADVAGPVLEQDILTELNVNITDDFTSGENSVGKVDQNFKDPGDIKESIEVIDHKMGLLSELNIHESFEDTAETESGTQRNKVKPTDELEASSSVTLPLECSICGEKCDDSDALHRHIRLHSNDKNGMNCYICKRQFQTKKMLMQHRKVHRVIRVHKCPVCEKKFSCYSSLARHKITHSNERPHKCTVCDKRFNLKNTLRMHMFTHSKERPHSCDQCGRSYTTRSLLKSHTRTHTGEKPYVCDICRKCFSHPVQLKDHKALHAGGSAHICNICGKKYTTLNSLRRHIATIGPNHKKEVKAENEFDRLVRIALDQHGGKSYVCGLCGKKYSAKHSLKRHHQWTHTGNLPFKCDICNMSFGSNWRFKEHTRRHLMKKHYCNICGRKFAIETKLINHLKRHETQSRECEHCGKKFKSNYLLKRHKMTHSKQMKSNNDSTTTKCHICDKEFRTASLRKRHLVSHQAELPYKCDTCGKAFTIASHLARHNLTHTGERPHKCDICDRAFTTSCALVRHRRVHTGERPHGCDVCGKEFICGYQLRIHRYSHSGQWPTHCTVCGKGFLRAKLMQKHMLSHGVTMPQDKSAKRGEATDGKTG